MLMICCGLADRQSASDALAACAARRWLARNAAGVKLFWSRTEAAASACVSLVSCLPALESVELRLRNPLVADSMGCLLEALAWCPRLSVLVLSVIALPEQESDEATWGSTDMPALAELRSLTKLDFFFGHPVPYTVTGVVNSLAHLTGLAELRLCLPARVPGQPVLVPATLGQHKALRSIVFQRIDRCVLEAGCLDLPNLLSLKFGYCEFWEAAVLPGVSALQSLTCIEFSGGQTPRFMDFQLVHLPLQHMEYAPSGSHRYDDARSALARLPADMGRLSLTLVHLSLSGYELTQFPLALTQLVALKCLNARRNEFAQLPLAITALSRLTVLMLGRQTAERDPLQLNEQHPLDVRALGDLSGFPALRELEFECCEVMLCKSVLGAVRHASLMSLSFCLAHPAPECALVVLQLKRALMGVSRGGVLNIVDEPELEQIFDWHRQLYGDALAPFHKFKGALEACGL